MRIIKNNDYYARQLKTFEQEKATHSVSGCLDLFRKALEHNDSELCIYYLSRAIQLDPSDPELIKQRAKLYFVLERYEDAMSDIQYLLYLDADNKETLYAKELLEQKMHYQKLVSAFPVYN